MGPKELQKNIKDKFKIDLPYMRLFNGKQHAMDSIYGNWQESFQLLYSFKGEVERTSPGSIVDIDHHTVEYTFRGVTKTKECFRRVFSALRLVLGVFWQVVGLIWLLMPLFSQGGLKDS